MSIHEIMCIKHHTPCGSLLMKNYLFLLSSIKLEGKMDAGSYYFFLKTGHLKCSSIKNMLIVEKLESTDVHKE